MARQNCTPLVIAMRNLTNQIEAVSNQINDVEVQIHGLDAGNPQVPPLQQHLETLMQQETGLYNVLSNTHKELDRCRNGELSSS
jgi:hypothetical protein